MFKGKFEDIVQSEDGFLRGPFGSALKKSLFVPKSDDAYKVYEQGVVLQQDKNIGEYYISKEYFDEAMSRFEVKSGDFLVSCSGVNYGAIYQIKGKVEKGIINQALLRIRLNHEMVDDSYFLYYFRAYISKRIVGGTGDSTIPNFPSMSVVKNIEIEIPDIEKQRKIGKVLANIEEKINNNYRISMELESMAKTIYDYWFLQFEFPNEEGKPYKSSGGKMVWNEELKREIPAGWENGNFSDLIEIGNGRDHKELQDGKIPVYGSGGVMRLVDTSIYDGESVLIPRKGTLNNVIYVNGAFWTVDTMFYSKMKMKHIAIFTYYSAKLYDFEKLNTGTGVPSMTSSIIYNLKTVIPTKQVLKDFDEMVQSLYRQIHKNNIENRELMSLRDFLLPLLMNGQIGFRE